MVPPLALPPHSLRSANACFPATAAADGYRAPCVPFDTWKFPETARYPSAQRKMISHPSPSPPLLPPSTPGLFWSPKPPAIQSSTGLTLNTDTNNTHKTHTHKHTNIYTKRKPSRISRGPKESRSQPTQYGTIVKVQPSSSLSSIKTRSSFSSSSHIQDLPSESFPLNKSRPRSTSTHDQYQGATGPARQEEGDGRRGDPPPRPLSPPLPSCSPAAVSSAGHPPPPPSPSAPPAGGLRAATPPPPPPLAITSDPRVAVLLESFRPPIPQLTLWLSPSLSPPPTPTAAAVVLPKPLPRRPPPLKRKLGMSDSRDWCWWCWWLWLWLCLWRRSCRSIT